ncbi:unnamed protein product [Acanthoscelides obtectus]|uniref:Octanoyl-[acyl-carrier-protein]:protein N-octanoyltransferase LIPT2, mitochondrial n=1 Tax=Acanthoscelides obtectus TaxID=200917 RepID=A0A9P0PHG0_ACAOB|nr:unnamed protein product [Acanthoscelides obtectus]CAK1652703.1 Putative lipoyltransferase 2, mitochondrial [Acanthoscelides obtectus]
MERLVKVWKVGKISYSKAYKLQKYLASLHHREQGNNNTLLCLEHPPVYTIGIRTARYDNTDISDLQKRGAEYFKTDRGGLITFHGPGQLVVYPILNLKHFKPSIKWYVSSIQETVLKLCEEFNIPAETNSDTGVWVEDRKICAIGIHGSKFITTHGFAINCNTDLRWFDYIVPCGLEGKGVTSFSNEVNRLVTVGEVMPKFLDCFQQVFQCSLTDFPRDEARKILGSLEDDEDCREEAESIDFKKRNAVEVIK